MYKKNNDLTQVWTKQLLEELHDKYNRPNFIKEDPIVVPHSFSLKEDIEISGFLTAILAWGQRGQIIKNANYLMNLMDNAPADFVKTSSQKEQERLQKFYYRTFKGVDARFFIYSLKDIYINRGGLEKVFTTPYQKTNNLINAIINLYNIFSSIPHQKRSMKHIANVSKGSSAKRINMFLRWMVRKDSRGVDFGLWNDIPSSALYIPLDIHSGRTARELNLLKRKQNDWKSVDELTQALRNYDSLDPVKYDFALFGAGIHE